MGFNIFEAMAERTTANAARAAGGVGTGGKKGLKDALEGFWKGESGQKFRSTMGDLMANENVGRVAANAAFMGSVGAVGNSVYQAGVNGDYNVIGNGIGGFVGGALAGGTLAGGGLALKALRANKGGAARAAEAAAANGFAKGAGVRGAKGALGMTDEQYLKLHTEMKAQGAQRNAARYAQEEADAIAAGRATPIANRPWTPSSVHGGGRGSHSTSTYNPNGPVVGSNAARGGRGGSHGYSTYSPAVEAPSYGGVNGGRGSGHGYSTYNPNGPVVESNAARGGRGGSHGYSTYSPAVETPSYGGVNGGRGSGHGYSTYSPPANPTPVGDGSAGRGGRGGNHGYSTYSPPISVGDGHAGRGGRGGVHGTSTYTPGGVMDSNSSQSTVETVFGGVHGGRGSNHGYSTYTPQSTVFVSPQGTSAESITKVRHAEAIKRRAIDPKSGPAILVNDSGNAMVQSTAGAAWNKLRIRKMGR